MPVQRHVEQKAESRRLTISELAEFVEAARAAEVPDDVELVVTTRTTLRGAVLRSIATGRQHRNRENPSGG